MKLDTNPLHKEMYLALKNDDSTQLAKLVGELSSDIFECNDDFLEHLYKMSKKFKRTACREYLSSLSYNDYNYFHNISQPLRNGTPEAYAIMEEDPNFADELTKAFIAHTIHNQTGYHEVILRSLYEVLPTTLAKLCKDQRLFSGLDNADKVITPFLSIEDKNDNSVYHAHAEKLIGALTDAIHTQEGRNNTNLWLFAYALCIRHDSPRDSLDKLMSHYQNVLSKDPDKVRTIVNYCGRTLYPSLYQNACVHDELIIHMLHQLSDWMDEGFLNLHTFYSINRVFINGESESDNEPTPALKSALSRYINSIAKTSSRALLDTIWRTAKYAYCYLTPFVLDVACGLYNQRDRKKDDEHILEIYSNIKVQAERINAYQIDDERLFSVIEPLLTLGDNGVEESLWTKAYARNKEEYLTCFIQDGYETIPILAQLYLIRMSLSEAFQPQYEHTKSSLKVLSQKFTLSEMLDNCQNDITRERILEGLG